MGDLVDLRLVREERSPHLHCECGSKWWVAHVNISKDLEVISGWKIEGLPGLPDSTPMCSQCGKSLIEQVFGDDDL